MSIFSINFILGWLWYRATQPALSGDFLAYFELALGMIDHQQYGYPGPSALRLPAYPTLLALLYWITSSHLVIFVCNIALTASIGVLIYFLALQLTRGNERTATIAGFICAFSPTYFFFAPIWATEHLFAPLFIGALLLLASGRLRPVPRMVVAGVMLGVAILTRGEGMFYLPVALSLIVWNVKETRRRVVLCACMLCAVLAVITPWYIRNAVVLGSRVGLSTYGGLNFYYAHNDQQYGWYLIDGRSPLGELGEVAENQEGFRRGFAYLRENPLRLVSDAVKGTKSLYAIKDIEIVRSALFVPAYASESGEAFRRKYPPGAMGLYEKYFLFTLLLAAPAIAFRRRYPPLVWLVPFGVVAMNWLCHTIVFWGKPRFRFTMVAFLYLLAGVTISELSRWRERRRGERA